MKVYFTAAEYNPFHNGHAYQIRKTREAGATHFAAVMSPNFVQRGAPAFFDKFKRAAAAVTGGADIVFELPLPFAVASAERFADGAVQAALCSGFCDGFSFGCETDHPEDLFKIAELMNGEDFQDRIRTARADGCSYPVACVRVCGEQYAETLSGPNNLLGIEYIRALTKRGFRGDILPIRRVGAGHGDSVVSGQYASGAALRELIRTKQDFEPFVSRECCAIYQKEIENGFYAEHYRNEAVSLLRTLPQSAFERLPDANGGFGSRLFHAVRDCGSYDGILSAAKTKRYTYASLSRGVWQAILGITAEDASCEIQYLRPLSYRVDSAPQLFERNQRDGSVPILTGALPAEGFDERCKRAYDLEDRATDLYNSFLCTPRPCGTDHTDRIFYMQGTVK